MLSLLAETALIVTPLRELSKNDLATVLVPPVFAFLIGILLAPAFLRFLTQHELWRKQKTLRSLGGEKASITQKLNDDTNLKVPRFGGLLIVGGVGVTTLFFWLLGMSDLSGWVRELDFVNRGETWLVIFSLIAGSIIGGLDDLSVVGRLNFLQGKLKEYIGGGLPLRLRLLIATSIGLFSGWWFYDRLEVTSIEIPFSGSWEIGILIIPFIIITMIATYSGGIIDGVDGLAGGVFATIFTVYAFIALLQGSVDLATFCFVVVGAICAFLWYNIPPAKFYMSEVGSMALTMTISVIAFLTDTVFLLPIIAFPLLLSSGSVILQRFWRKVFNKKLLLVSPIHNHFRAQGRPDYNVTMRYWIMSQIAAMSGLAIFLLGYNF